LSKPAVHPCGRTPGLPFWKEAGQIRRIMERLVPGLAPQPIFIEHIRRYEFALPYVRGVRVADISCGSGYGSYELAVRGKASTVVGVDISETAIEYAREHYRAPNLRFETGDATGLVFEEESFDVITSFETIEHIHRFKDYLDELYRVSRPGGTCLISTPNKRLSFKNPYHTKEFTFAQFRRIVLGHFSHVDFLGQDRLTTSGNLLLRAQVIASKTLPEGVKRALAPESLRGDDEERTVGGIVDEGIKRCRYFMAVCRKCP
jgi:ubiquinone/menaquinone biosynthesis C-methylase UbiE